MKNSQITLIIIGFILVALMATNPSTEEHKQVIKKAIFSSINSDNKSNTNIAQQLGENIGESIGSAFIDKIVVRQNLLLFSLGNMEYEGKSQNRITLGIFGQIFLLKQYDKNSNEFVDKVKFGNTGNEVKADSPLVVVNNSPQPLKIISDWGKMNLKYKVYSIYDVNFEAVIESGNLSKGKIAFDKMRNAEIEFTKFNSSGNIIEEKGFRANNELSFSEDHFVYINNRLIEKQSSGWKVHVN